MADKKISALTAASTPLAGTEVLPIVQGGSTVKVSIANVTAGRNIGTAAITTTGNVGVKCTPLSITPLQVYLGADRRLSTFLNGSDNVLGFLTDAGNWTSTFFTGTPAIFGNGASEAFRIDTNQNIVMKTAGKGIDFSANANAPGMTSELLDWYEEGTWAIADISGAGLTLTVDHAKYTRVGNLVTINAYITYPVTVDASVNQLSLPFTASQYDIGTAGASTGNVYSAITIGGAAAVSARNLSQQPLLNVNLSGAQVLMSFTYMV